MTRRPGCLLAATVAAVTARQSRTAPSGPIASTRVGVAELAAIVRGRNPRHRRLYAPQNGFWIRVSGDTIRSFEQQYTP